MAGHAQGKSCGCCSMSRRCFLGAATAAAASPLVGGLCQAAAESDVGEYVELESLRPRPEVRILGAFVRLKPPYWLGWPGTSYDVEGHRKRFSAELAESAKRLGVQFELEPEAVESEEAVNALAERVEVEQPDAVLLTLQHLHTWKWADRITQAGVPTIIFAPIGTAFTQHVLEISRRPGVHVISSLEMDAVTQAFRIVRAKRQLE